MGKQDKARRVYTREFKAEAVALAEKHEKPARQIAQNLGINENQLYRWIRRARDAEGGGLPPFPGYGRPRDEEVTRLRKEVKALRETIGVYVCRGVL
ncbi:MAG: transposase [Treponema sp.]|jgi:transposase|nr:transposase [Treponema sp.]